jgi:hypothetical protein
MLYYANGGPGPASKLLRVDAPEGADPSAWRGAPAWSWQPKTGWRPNTNAQLDILTLGEFFLIDESQVIEVQHQMLLQWAKFHYSH